MLLALLIASLLLPPHSMPQHDVALAPPPARHECAAPLPMKDGPATARPASPSALVAGGKGPVQVLGEVATPGRFALHRDDEPADFLPELLAREVRDGSDVVLLLDHTASMGDDIERIRVEFESLRRVLEAKQGVRFGAVTFSDLRRTGDIGYRARGLSRDFGGIDQFLLDVMLVGSVEDVNGALLRTLEDFDWRPGAPRLLLVITDEGAALPPEARATAAEVLRHAAACNPPAEIQPILIRKD